MLFYGRIIQNHMSQYSACVWCFTEFSCFRNSFWLPVNPFFAPSYLPCSTANVFWNFITTFERSWADLNLAKSSLDRGLACFEPVFTVDSARVWVLFQPFLINNQQSAPWRISWLNKTRQALYLVIEHPRSRVTGCWRKIGAQHCFDVHRRTLKRKTSPTRSSTRNEPNKKARNSWQNRKTQPWSTSIKEKTRCHTNTNHE